MGQIVIFSKKMPFDVDYSIDLSFYIYTKAFGFSHAFGISKGNGHLSWAFPFPTSVELST